MNLSLIAIVLVGLVAALCGLVVANLKAQQRDVQEIGRASCRERVLWHV